MKKRKNQGASVIVPVKVYQKGFPSTLTASLFPLISSQNNDSQRNPR